MEKTRLYIGNFDSLLALAFFFILQEKVFIVHSTVHMTHDTHVAMIYT